jgi:uncharacterized protein (AIM24 family)
MRSELFSAENMEKESTQPGLRLQNSKMLKVELNGEVMARRGAMVGYQGQVQFQALGAGGIGKWLKSKVTGEGVPIMKMIGRGDVFNCLFNGAGRIAVTTHGTPVVVNVDQPTYADPQAAVCWSASLQTGFHKAENLGLGTLIGRTTGEMFTMSFTGQGFVVIQPSELPPGAVSGHGSGQQSGSGGVLGGLFGD